MILVLRDGIEKVEESWKPFIYNDTKTNYEVSTFGNIRNIKTGRILKQHEQNDGYYGFTISINGELHSFKTAPIVAKLFIKNDEPSFKTQVNHKIGQRKYDNSIYNLEWVSPAENQRHASKTGLRLPHRCSPSSGIIHKVCSMLEHNIGITDIQKATGVTSGVIYNILAGTNYKEISKNYDFSNRETFKSGPRNKYSNDTIRKVYTLWIKGYLMSEISDMVDIPENTLYGMLYKKKFASIRSEFDFSKRKRKTRSRAKTEDIIEE